MGKPEGVKWAISRSYSFLISQSAFHGEKQVLYGGRKKNVSHQKKCAKIVLQNKLLRNLLTINSS